MRSFFYLKNVDLSCRQGIKEMFFGRSATSKLQHPKEKQCLSHAETDSLGYSPEAQRTPLHSCAGQKMENHHQRTQHELSLFQSICHLSLLIICCLAGEEFSRVLFPPYTSLLSILILAVCFYLWASKSYLASIKGLWMSRKREREYSKLM